MSINKNENNNVKEYAELPDQEMDLVSGGASSGSGYQYVSMSLDGNILKVRAGWDVRTIHVYRNDSQIRYTRTMSAGEVMDISLFGNAPMTFKVTGHIDKYNEDFEYTFIG